MAAPLRSGLDFSIGTVNFSFSGTGKAIGKQSKETLDASVVKLVDTPDSKSGSLTGVAVQVRPLVPNLSL